MIAEKDDVTVASWNQQKLKPEVKAAWLEALRSGQYLQTTGFLARDGGYCCLGVLCDIAVQDGAVTKIGEFPQILKYGDGEEFATKVLPDQVARWSGMFSDNPSLEVLLTDIPSGKLNDIVAIGNVRDGELGKVVRTSLAELNDVFGFSFEEIADIVEKYL